MIKVLIVEDSRVVSQYLEYIFSRDSMIEVIGNVSNGKAAIDFINQTKPDVITMDIDMPIMNGLEATRIIMSTLPVPIIVVTANLNSSEIGITMQALAAGALSVIEKPVGIGHPNEEEKSARLINMVKLLSEIKVVRRIPAKSNNKNKKTIVYEHLHSLGSFYKKRIVTIGISTGGPQVLERIFSKITSRFPYPIIVVQHITEGFLEGLVTWLGHLLNIPTQIAKDHEIISPGRVYFAPDLHQIEIIDFKFHLSKCSYRPGILCPSVGHLFNSLANNHAKDTIAFLMTGMGKDGAQELKMLRDAGAVTIAQDKESSVVYGMPGEAAKLGAAEYIQNPDEIANLLYEIEKYYMNEKRN